MSNFRLTQLFFAFFMRTDFVNMDDVERDIRGTIFDFKNSTRRDLQIPLPPDNIPIDLPIFSLVTSNSTINIKKKKIEYIINGIYDAQYNDVLGMFAANSKLLSNYCTNEYNICSRIGMVNNSFLVTDEADNVIKKQLLTNRLSNVNNISLSYVRHSDDLKKLEIINISNGTLHESPPKKGIIISKDINIPKNLKKISEKEIGMFIDENINLINKSSMIKEILDV